MSLVAVRHPIVAALIDVIDDSRDHSEGNVVYRYNEAHRCGTRTHHDGPPPPMGAIRAAITAEQTVVRDPAAWSRVALEGRRHA